MPRKPPKIIIIAGATASGKTAAAVKLAKEIDGEIVSADSMQIYKGLNIGTAKPNQAEMRGVKHHLIDFLPPNAEYNAALYQKDARKIIENLRDGGVTPIVAGGTGLYINSLLYDMTFSQSGGDCALRKRLEAQYDEIGGDAMLSELSRLNPSAAKPHANDKKRVIRALETALTGKKPDGDEFNSKPYYGQDEYIFFGLNRDRQELYQKIDERVDGMIKSGLVGEIESLLSSGLSFDAQSMQSIGYKEFKAYFSGTAPLAETVEQIKRHTRNYAKRQITWFKRYNNIIRVDAGEGTDAYDGILNSILQNSIL
ncbi:MAG: tRNA (adenosine(37)-N6)-dimethylallyltransferase MiaA [Clostridiales bacterium]|jgi:tRNA dimethylallyltransferase|nr:tRNA (adenosine(37)-N6)-dimethylallyltransferase MiaA [Clostridiales bacterium]